MTDAERTMREEQWMLSSELLRLDQHEPPIITAFRALDAAALERFMSDLRDNPALRFFNPEQVDFSCAASWDALAAECGIEPHDHTWRIDPRLEPAARDFCRELRSVVRNVGAAGTGGLQSFVYPDGVYPSAAAKPILIVQHDGGGLAPYFNPSYERPADYRLVDQLLNVRNLWREMQDGGTTYIYRT